MISLIDLRRARAAHALNHLEGGKSVHVPIDDDQVRGAMRHGDNCRCIVGDGAHSKPGLAKSLAERFD